VTPSNVSVNRGETQQFRAVVSGSGSILQNVTWSVMGATSRSTNITLNGLLSVAANETAPTLIITATSHSDPSKSETVTVTVTNDAPRVDSVVVSPNTVVVEKGTTQQFTATVNGTNNPSQAVTWTVTGGMSSGTGISTNGLLVVAINENASSLTIRATSNIDNSKRGTATVTPPVTISNITVSSNSPIVGKGKTHQFIATVSGTNNPSQTVTWTVTGGNDMTRINENGLLSVAINETASTLTVTATSIIDTNKNGFTTIAISQIGSLGQGGGYIFYDKGSYSDGWRYLEAAPANCEFKASWGLNSIACPDTKTGIGTGKANTMAIINQLNTNKQTKQAAQMCSALTINGFSDWFLPSKDELNEMYLRLRVGNNIGEFSIGTPLSQGWYWSSSVGSSISKYTWCQRFSDGHQTIAPNIVNRSNELIVRAIRAF